MRIPTCIFIDRFSGWVCCLSFSCCVLLVRYLFMCGRALVQEESIEISLSSSGRRELWKVWGCTSLRGLLRSEAPSPLLSSSLRKLRRLPGVYYFFPRISSLDGCVSVSQRMGGLPWWIETDWPSLFVLSFFLLVDRSLGARSSALSPSLTFCILLLTSRALSSLRIPERQLY